MEVVSRAKVGPDESKVTNSFNLIKVIKLKKDKNNKLTAGIECKVHHKSNNEQKQIPTQF